MSTTFVPPRPDQWEGPAQGAQAKAFVPPSPDQWEGPAKGFTPPPVESEEKKKEKPSAIGEFAKGVGDVLNPLPLLKQYATPEGLMDLASGRPAGPIVRGMWEGAKEQAGKTKEAFQQGKYSEAIGHGLATVLPGVGPMAANAAETMGGQPGTTDKYGNETAPTVPPNVPRGLGQAAAIAAPIADAAAGSPVSGLAGKAVKGTTAAIRSTLERVEPYQAMTQALKPKSTNVGFKPGELDRAMPELKLTEQIAGTPITDLQTLKNAIDLSKQRVWSQYEKIMGPQAERGVDASPVADAMSKAVSEKARQENPGLARRIDAVADTYRKPLTIKQMEEYIQAGNAELNAYYGKYPSARGADVRGNPLIASKVAQVEALRQRLYSVLDDASDGAVPAELKKRYGSLMNVEREVESRLNVADRQQPDSLVQQAGKVGAASQILRGAARGVLAHDYLGAAADVAGGIGAKMAADYVKEQQTTNALIRRAFANYEGTPEPLQMPAPFRPKGLLEAPSQKMPAAPDTSFVRGVPAMQYPPNPMRALPPASTYFAPPADTVIDPATGLPQQTTNPIPGSYVRGVPAFSPFDPRFRRNP